MKWILETERFKSREIIQDDFDNELKSWIEQDYESAEFMMDEPENKQ